jgi:hypothetical protein
MLTLIITKDKKEVKRFENQTSDFEAFKYLLNHNSSSTSRAVKYEGWDVEIIDNETGEKSTYSEEYNKHKY